MSEKLQPEKHSEGGEEKLSTEVLKSHIDSWLTDSEIERLRNEFVPPQPAEEFAQQVRNQKSWKRISKMKEDGRVLRIFDCKPLDDQLRLYVYSNASDSEIVEHYFQTE